MTLFRVLALALCCALAVSAKPLTVEASLAKKHAGQRIEVEVIKTKAFVVGHLGPVQAESFVLISEDRKKTERVFRFDEVRSVRPKMEASKKWAIGLLVFGVFMGLGAIQGK